MSFARYDGTVRTAVGEAIPRAEIAVLTQPANTSTLPGSPLATLYAASATNTPTISAISWLAGISTVTVNALPADLVLGSYIRIKTSNPATFNGVWQVTGVNSGLNQFTFTLTPNPGTYLGAATMETSALPNPTVSDSLGNFFFYLTPGTYTIQIYTTQAPTIPPLILADQALVAGGAGSGTVTSVALTMPAEFAVSGSPVTTTGTLAVTKANENVNTVFAGPSGGGAAVPTFRALVTADLPAGTGTVSSVALTCTVPAALLTSSVGGSPVTGSGTLAITINLANQSPNQVFAGPASGGAAAPAFRALVAADFPGTLLQSATVSLSSADILALLGTPKTLVAAQGAGKTIVPVHVYIHFAGGSIAYTDAGGALNLNVGSLTQALASNAIFLVTVSPNVNVQVLTFAATATAGNPPSCDNAPLTLSKSTNNFAAGNGTASITVFYLVVTT